MIILIFPTINSSPTRHGAITGRFAKKPDSDQGHDVVHHRPQGVFRTTAIFMGLQRHVRLDRLLRQGDHKGGVHQYVERCR